MTLLSTALTAYDLAQAVQPERCRVTSAPMRRYSKIVQALVRCLGQEATLPLWESLVGSAKAARWRASAEAVPFSWAGSSARPALEEVIRQANRLDRLVDADPAAWLQALAKAAADLVEEDNAALADALLTCLSDGDPDDTCVVSCRGRSAVVTSNWLRQQGVTVPVLTPRDFLRGRGWDFAVVVGPSDWYPSRLITCPSASAVTLIHYAHIRDSERVCGVFGTLATTPIAVRIRDDGVAERDGNDSLQESAVEQLPQPQWSALVQQAAPRTATPDEYKVAARLLAMVGESGLWLPVDATSIRGLDAHAPRGERILHLRAGSVTAGSVLVIRENGTISGTLAAMADSLLGPSAKEIRQRQREWKERLRQQLVRVGHNQLERVLRTQGSSTANLRFWAGEDNIRPLHDHDFVVLLRYLGFSDPAPYLEDGRSLWRAHHGAGARLTAALEDLVEKADLSELEASGRQQLELGQDGARATLTAVRVLAVNQEAHEVPLSATRRPFPLRGARWLE